MELPLITLFDVGARGSLSTAKLWINGPTKHCSVVVAEPLCIDVAIQLAWMPKWVDAMDAWMPVVWCHFSGVGREDEEG